MALTSLIPDPNDPTGKLPPQLANLRAPDPGPPQGGLPSLGTLPPLQSAPAMPGLRPLVTSPRQQQEQGLQNRISQFENPAPRPGGFWHGLAHTLNVVRNVAEQALVPGVAAADPTNPLHQQIEHGQNVRELGGLQTQDLADQQQFSDNTMRMAQTAKLQAETPTPEDEQAGLEHTQAETAALNRPDLAHAYANAVQSAMARGADPQADPVVQHLADAITSIQKQTAPKEDASKTADLIGPDGKEHLMGWNAKTGKYDIDMGRKGEKPTQAPGVTVVVPDGQGGGKVERLTPGSTVAPGAQTASQFGSVNTPTMQQRNVGAQARLVNEQMPGLISEIQKNAALMGPVAGRWNDFMQGKIGSPNPEMAGLRSDLLMMSSAVALMHARGRLPENLREEFDRTINAPQQSPENLVSVLRHINEWTLANERAMGGGGMTPGNAAPQSAPQRPANVPEGYVFKEGPKGKGWYKP